MTIRRPNAPQAPTRPRTDATRQRNRADKARYRTDAHQEREALAAANQRLRALVGVGPDAKLVPDSAWQLPPSPAERVPVGSAAYRALPYDARKRVSAAAAKRRARELPLRLAAENLSMQRWLARHGDGSPPAGAGAAGAAGDAATGSATAFALASDSSGSGRQAATSADPPASVLPAGGRALASRAPPAAASRVGSPLVPEVQPPPLQIPHSWAVPPRRPSPSPFAQAEPAGGSEHDAPPVGPRPPPAAAAGSDPASGPPAWPSASMSWLPSFASVRTSPPRAGLAAAVVAGSSSPSTSSALGTPALLGLAAGSATSWLLDLPSAALAGITSAPISRLAGSPGSESLGARVLEGESV